MNNQEFWSKAITFAMIMAPSVGWFATLVLSVGLLRVLGFGDEPSMYLGLSVSVVIAVVITIKLEPKINARMKESGVEPKYILEIPEERMEK